MTDRIPLSDQLIDRWEDILPKLGIPAKILNRRHQPCPMCGGTDRFRFDNKQGRGTWICTHCGSGDGVALIMKVNGWDFRATRAQIEPLIGAARQVKKSVAQPRDRRRDLNDLWLNAKPIAPGCPAGLYLTKRTGITEYPSCLRSVESLRYWGDGIARYFPAMIAMVTDAAGKPANLCRTYLTKDGKKAPVDPPRRMMPGPIPKGSATRLAQATDVLGIAEGIETAISASLIHGVPTWAALGTAGLSSWLPPEGVTRVLVFGDCDHGFGGQVAAYALAYRLTALPGRTLTVEVHIPGHVTTGQDWNDVHAETKAEAYQPQDEACRDPGLPAAAE